MNARWLAISFRSAPAAGERVLAAVSEDGVKAVAADLAGGPPSAEVGSAMTVAVVAGPGALPLDEQQRLEDWIARASQTDPAGDLRFQSDRVRLKGARALIYAAASVLDDYLLGLAAFAYNEIEIGELRSDVSEKWRQLGALLGGGGVDKLDRDPREAAVAVAEIGQLRMRFVALEQAVFYPPAPVPAGAHRLLNELALLNRHTDRLEAIGERLEVLSEVSQVWADRSLATSQHRREIIAEVVISILLLIETVVILYDLVR
jgi:hypothetical protein